jgi:hypothetical protein
MQEALEYLDEMNSIKVCGYNNWRLPTLEELAISLFQSQDITNLDIILKTKPNSAIWTADSLFDEGVLIIKVGVASPGSFPLWRYDLLWGMNLPAHIVSVPRNGTNTGYVLPIRSGFGRY